MCWHGFYDVIIMSMMYIQGLIPTNWQGVPNAIVSLAGPHVFSNFKPSLFLYNFACTFYMRQESPKQVLWQIVKTLINCRIIWQAFHQGLHCLLRQKWIMYNIFFKLKPVTFQYIQWTILTFLYVALWKIPLVLNGIIFLEMFT